jgi:hypothetical protein
MLQQPYRLLLHELVHHIGQHRSDSIKPLIRLTNISKPHFIHQDLLHNENSNLSSDHLTVLDNSDPVSMIRRQSGIISVDKRKLTTSALSFWVKHEYSDKSSDHTQRSQSKVFKRSSFVSTVQEWVQE